MLQEREIPQNIEAEQSVLGAMLIDKNAVELISEQLKPEDFYRQTHQVIFKTMMELHSRKEAVDMVTVINELKKTEKLNDVGGISYITFLAGKVPTAANATFHARIVVEKSILRQLVETGTSIAAMGYDDAGSVTDILKEDFWLKYLNISKFSQSDCSINGFVTLFIGTFHHGNET